MVYYNKFIDYNMHAGFFLVIEKLRIKKITLNLVIAFSYCCCCVFFFPLFGFFNNIANSAFD